MWKPTEAGFKSMFHDTITRGSIPIFKIQNTGDLDTTNADTARLVSLLQAWQGGGYQLAPPSWPGCARPHLKPRSAHASRTRTGCPPFAADSSIAKHTDIDFQLSWIDACDSVSVAMHSRKCSISCLNGWCSTSAESGLSCFVGALSFCGNESTLYEGVVGSFSATFSGC